MTHETDAARAERLEEKLKAVEADRDRWRSTAHLRGLMTDEMLKTSSILRARLADERRKGWEEGREAAWDAIDGMCAEEAEFRTLTRAQAEIRALTPPAYDAPEPTCKGSVQVAAYDEAEAARIDEALALFSSDLSEFETRADAVWCLARAWENVIEALDIGDTSDDPAQRIREMIEYVGTLQAENAALREDVAKLREAAGKAHRALLPLKIGVFNDNGDFSVSTHVPSYDEQIAGYFAIKTVERALAATKREEPGE